MLNKFTDLDQLVDAVFPGIFGTSNFKLVPEENGATVYVKLAGWKSGQIKVDFAHGMLTVSSADDQKNPLGERFNRSLQLDYPVDSSNIKATMEDGLLTIRVPRKDYSAPRRIEVNTG